MSSTFFTGAAGWPERAPRAWDRRRGVKKSNAAEIAMTRMSVSHRGCEARRVWANSGRALREQQRRPGMLSDHSVTTTRVVRRSEPCATRAASRRLVQRMVRAPRRDMGSRIDDLHLRAARHTGPGGRRARRLPVPVGPRSSSHASSLGKEFGATPTTSKRDALGTSTHVVGVMVVPICRR